ncbi:bifunctional helix-turn-helix transcriptional regulator/GNAT family N-acetyltransferase [Virgisporangium ochraceum]|nr:helix-turn-helix domain-containing GNAT family N-acetyltransferase [Virgisporangium ochraceum]
MTDAVLAVREFSRFYTGVIGLLGSYQLAEPYSLTEARVLYELGQADSADTLDLRTRLSLDPGYLSRIVAKLEAAGLVVRERSIVDGRKQVLRLTDAGREVQRDLDARSSAHVAGLLAHTSEPERRSLVSALSTVRTVLSSHDTGPVTLRPLRPGDLGWVVQRHGQLYAAEYGWDVRFEGVVAGLCAEYATASAPDPRQAGWIAELGGGPVGSIFCMRRSDDVAQLRMLLVEPAARGHGVGTTLVDECLRFAKEAGYREIVLWTNAILHAARRIYERVGFTLDHEGEPPAWGGPVRAEQIWRRAL